MSADKKSKQTKNQLQKQERGEENMFTKLNSKKGFTLIELMIVVVIIGILAALAIPRFMRASTKSKQSEAKQILKQIYVMQQAYRQEKDTYWAAAGPASAAAQNAFSGIGVEIMPSARYTYTILTATTTVLSVSATSSILDDDATLDTWMINDAGTLSCSVDDATS